MLKRIIPARKIGKSRKEDGENVRPQPLVQISVLEHTTCSRAYARDRVTRQKDTRTHARAHAKCNQLPGMRETGDTRNLGTNVPLRSRYINQERGLRAASATCLKAWRNLAIPFGFLPPIICRYRGEILFVPPIKYISSNRTTYIYVYMMYVSVNSRLILELIIPCNVFPLYSRLR